MSNPQRTWLPLFVAMLGGAAASSTGCNAVECADGTIEQDGVCVPADEVVDEATCGPGTVLGTGGVCVVETPTVCGPNTMEDTTTIPGTVLCVGTGAGDCSTEITCPPAAMNRVSVCGRLYDVETDQRIVGVDATGLNCEDPDAVQSGPCELGMQFFDALEFAGDPEGATPLEPEQFYIDDCGRFRAHNIQRPSLGFLGIGADDTTAGDTHRLTGTAFPVVSAEVRNGQKVYVVETATDDAWSTQAGLDPGFVDRGAFMTVFLIGGVPEEGVKIIEGGAVESANDYYFGDTDPSTRSTVLPDQAGEGPEDATGVNGAGIKINSALVEHSGMGGALPGGCTWESALAASIQGVLFFSPRHALMGGTECE
jgi:hypothetical protein